MYKISEFWNISLTKYEFFKLYLLFHIQYSSEVPGRAKVQVKLNRFSRNVSRDRVQNTVITGTNPSSIDWTKDEIMVPTLLPTLINWISIFKEFSIWFNHYFEDYCFLHARLSSISPETYVGDAKGNNLENNDWIRLKTLWISRLKLEAVLGL